MCVYTREEIERVTRVAFDIARGRDGRVCSTEKSNVMETGHFWRTEVTRVHAEAGDGITLSHMLADACAMELVRAPKQFDVILASNLFGDMLSDAAAMLTGSIGMLPSASLGGRKVCPAFMSQCTGLRQILLVRASPIRALRSSRWRWHYAGHSTARRKRTASMQRSARRWTMARAHATSAASCLHLRWAML